MSFGNRIGLSVNVNEGETQERYKREDEITETCDRERKQIFLLTRSW